MNDLMEWLFRSEHRMAMLESVARRNHMGLQPTQRDAMCFAGRPYWAASHKSNGSQACRDLVAAGLLVDDAGKRGKAKLQVNWWLVLILPEHKYRQKNTEKHMTLAQLVRLTDSRKKLLLAQPDALGEMEEARMALALNRFLDSCKGDSQ